MLTQTERDQFELLLQTLKANPKIIVISEMNELILKLDEADHKQIQSILSANKELTDVIFSLADLSAEQVSAYVHYINAMVTPKELTLTLHDKIDVSSIEKIADVIAQIKNYQIHRVGLHKLQLGSYGIDALKPLMTVLSGSHFKKIYLHDNKLHLLNEKIVIFLQDLLKNSNLTCLYLLNNSISSLDLGVLQSLHELRYSSDKRPVYYWPEWDAKRRVEFEENTLNDEKKLSLAKLLLKQASSESYRSPSEPIPYLVTRRQLFEMYNDFLDNAGKKNMCAFRHWMYSSKDIKKLSDDEKLILCNKIFQKFPKDAGLAKVLELNYAAGFQVSEESTFSCLNWFEHQNGIRHRHGGMSYVSALSLSPFKLTTIVIDKVVDVLKSSSLLSTVTMSFATLSSEDIHYLGKALAKLDEERYYAISIHDLQLDNHDDFKKLSLFLECFPTNRKGKLELQDANVGLLSGERLMEFAKLNFPGSLSLPGNQLEKRKDNLLPFLQSINVIHVDLGNNRLWELEDAILDPVFEYIKNSQKSITYYYPSHMNCSDLPPAEQLRHAKRTAKFEMLHEGYSSHTFPYKLTKAEYFDLFMNFIDQAPGRGNKISCWLNYHKEINLDYEQRYLLAKKYVKSVPDKTLELQLHGYQLKAIDKLMLHFELHQANPNQERYSELVETFSSAIQSGGVERLSLGIEVDDDSDLQDTKKESLVESFLNEILLKTCKANWPELTFYLGSINKLIKYKIEEDYDIKKLSNMVAWFTWFISTLIHHQYETLRSQVISIDQYNTVLDKVVKEILNYSEPESRLKLSNHLFTLLASQKAMDIFLQLTIDITQRAVIPALLLSKIIFLNNNNQLHEQLVSKATVILKMILHDYCEGRFLRSLSNALCSLTDVENIPSSRKIDVVHSVLVSNDDLDKLKNVLEKVALYLTDKKNVKESLVKDVQVHYANKQIPDEVKTEIDGHLQHDENILRVEAVKLKRRWQAQSVSHNKKRQFLQQINYWYLMQGLCELKQIEALLAEGDMAHSLLNVIGGLFNLNDAQKELYASVLGKYPNQSAILTYLGKIHCLDENLKLPLESRYKKFIQDILTEQSARFYEERYNLQKSTHLATIFKYDPICFSNWKRGASADFKDHVRDSHAEDKPLPLSMEQFIVEKIFLHKHLPLSVIELQKYVNEKNPERRVELRNKLLEMLKIKRSILDIGGNDARVECARLSFQYIIMELLENPELEKSKQVKLLKKALGTLSSLYLSGNEFSSDLYTLIESLQPKKINKKKIDHSKWKIVDTDNFWYLFTCGNLPGSCQRIDGNPMLNKSLLAYVIDGKNRLFAVLDDTGKMIARCVVRLMYDDHKKCPVLFMERIYSEENSSQLYDALRSFALSRARDLNVSLVRSFGVYEDSVNSGAKYKNKVSSLSSVATWEYVDALHRQIKDGVFQLSGCELVQNAVPKLWRSSSCGSLLSLTLFKDKAAAPKNKAQDDYLLKQSSRLVIYPRQFH